MKRFRLVFRNEFASCFRRPLFWVLLVIVLLTSWGLSTGGMRIESGDATVGGTQAWITSEFALAQMLTLVVALFYSFFLVVAAGMSVIHDRELKVGEVLHATPLRAGEYVWGKFLAVLAGFLVILAAHLLFTMLFFQWIPNPNAEDIRGPFSLLNYLRPALIFSIPSLIFFAGVSFALGERTNRPILVFIFPVAAILLCGFFLWNWSPSWLDPRWNQFLMLIDPAGFRWLNETWLTVDRGVEFYNTSRIQFDWVFWANRAAIILIGLTAVLWSQRRFSDTLRNPGKARRFRKQSAVAAPPSAGQEEAAGHPSLASLQMRTSLPGFLGGAWRVARTEMTELRSQPGLYLFIPIILLQTLGSSLASIGAFSTPLLLTSGTMAVNSMNALTLMVCLLLLFYTVESLQRERNTGLDSIFYATPVKSASVLFGKALANSLVGAVVVTAMLLACWLAHLIQNMFFGVQVPFELHPFFLSWGLLLIPTFLVWTSFVTLIQSVARNRYFTYAAGLAALIASGYYQFIGDMNWAFNWNLWGAVTWSDMGTFELNRSPLILNRVMVLGLTALLTAASVRFFNRLDPDASRTIHRLHPLNLLKGALRLLPFALLPLIAAGLLYNQVTAGFQGEAEENRQKDYWKKNLATFKDVPLPAMKSVDLDLDLEPAQRHFRVKGTYELFNHQGFPLRQIPLTVGNWDDLEWTLNGEEFEPEDRARLLVFTPPEPLQPGRTLSIGFSHQGDFPKGITQNGGGTGLFILPSGVVLHSFSPNFVPVLGYFEQIGVDDDNRYEPRDFPDDFYLESLEPAFGSPTAFTTRIRISGPQEYTFNSVGVLESEEVKKGRRTAVWVSDHPVKIFNVVAGRWKVKRGEGTAVFYHPEHHYNVDEISAGLEAARKYYSEWFYPYPWEELKLSEFPNLASYAQGFGTNITFSEGIGFLTRSDPKTSTAFLVTAHESAHQWWGNLLTPGRGPGGNILSEGMSHFSTILLMEQVKGLRERIEFSKRIEERYGDARRVDSERPLVKIDGSRPGDTTVTYDKGGWVFWMLQQHMGRDNMLAGLQEFMRRYEHGPDYPVLQDFAAHMREYAIDAEAFDQFVEQWFFNVVVPEYRLEEAVLEQAQGDGQWQASVRVKNRGAGRMAVEIAALRGQRFEEDGSQSAGYQEERQTVTLGEGESIQVNFECGFEPDRLLIDPDAKVLQLERDKAVWRF